MEKIKDFPTPPWDMESAAKRLTLEATAWNSHNPEMILEGYSDNLEMRDGKTFVNGKEELRKFLTNFFQSRINFRLSLDLWGALKGRMAVRFECEWNDPAGLRYKSYGVQVFQFNDAGFAEKRFASEEIVLLSEA